MGKRKRRQQNKGSVPKQVNEIPIVNTFKPEAVLQYVYMRKIQGATSDEIDLSFGIKYDRYTSSSILSKLYKDQKLIRVKTGKYYRYYHPNYLCDIKFSTFCPEDDVQEAINIYYNLILSKRDGVAFLGDMACQEIKRDKVENLYHALAHLMLERKIIHVYFRQKTKGDNPDGGLMRSAFVSSEQYKDQVVDVPDEAIWPSYLLESARLINSIVSDELSHNDKYLENKDSTIRHPRLLRLLGGSNEVYDHFVKANKDNAIILNETCLNNNPMTNELTARNDIAIQNAVNKLMSLNKEKEKQNVTPIFRPKPIEQDDQAMSPGIEPHSQNTYSDTKTEAEAGVHYRMRIVYEAVKGDKVQEISEEFYNFITGQPS